MRVKKRKTLIILTYHILPTISSLPSTLKRPLLSLQQVHPGERAASGAGGVGRARVGDAAELAPRRAGHAGHGRQTWRRRLTSPAALPRLELPRRLQ